MLKVPAKTKTATLFQLACLMLPVSSVSKALPINDKIQ